MGGWVPNVAVATDMQAGRSHDIAPIPTDIKTRHEPDFIADLWFHTRISPLMTERNSMLQKDCISVSKSTIKRYILVRILKEKMAATAPCQAPDRLRKVVGMSLDELLEAFVPTMPGID
jgi:hypothetical protein